MKTIETYLQTHTPHTWKSNHKRILHYQNWLTTREKPLSETQYKDILDYIGELQNQSKSNITINYYLKALSHYYHYKKLPDRTHQIRIKTTKKSILPLFTQTELDELYNHYQSTNQSYYQHSDKHILGLIIYQGIEQRELLNLNLSDLHLDQGKIYIPAGRSKKQSRTLPLESHQIMPLNDYITNHRKTRNDKLFSQQCTNLDRLQNQLKRLYQQVKTQSEALEMKVQKLGQLRQSRIAHWIKEEGLRKAQYKAGFRYVSNVAVYQTQDLEDLQEQIKLYHPMR